VVGEERAVIRFNLNGKDQYFSHILSEHELYLSREPKMLRAYVEREMVNKIASWIVDTVGLVWVEEYDMRLASLMRRGSIGKA